MNEFIVTLNNIQKRIRILDNSKAFIDDKAIDYEFFLKSGNTYRFRLNNKFYDVSVLKINDEKYSLNIDGEAFEAEVRTALQEKAKKLLEQKSAAHHKMEIKAPMPGMILKIKKDAGENVETGEPVIILEAMKMENEIRSPVKGKIEKILAAEGSAVEKGASLFIIT